MTRTISNVLAVLLVLGLAVGTVTAAPADQSVTVTTATGPSDDGGPPDFLGDLLDSVVPDFVGDLLESLPVPEFLKNLF